jgi:sugar phosphate isomerase/epimerase
MSQSTEAWTRRRLMLCGAALTLSAGASLSQAKIQHHSSTVRGVKLGIITGSLNPLPGLAGRDPIDVIIEECVAVGAANIELVTVGNETPPEIVDGGRYGQVPDVITPEYTRSREVLRQWRLAEPLDRYHEVRQKFARAGLNLFSYVWTVADDYTPQEIDNGFQKLRALGVKLFCTNQTRYTMGAKLIACAEKYQIYPAWHPHDNVADPREVATAKSLERLIDMSPAFRVNLDIGHFTAGNEDAVAFLQQHYARITHIHVKDRQRNHGPNVQLGTGDTPITQCLQLIRDHRWPIYVIIEREYRGPGSPVDETRGQMQWLSQQLKA